MLVTRGTPLLKGRLYYFTDQLSGPRSAAWYLQQARPSFEEIKQQRDAFVRAALEQAKVRAAELPPAQRQALL